MFDIRAAIIFRRDIIECFKEERGRSGTVWREKKTKDHSIMMKKYKRSEMKKITKLFYVSIVGPDLKERSLTMKIHGLISVSLLQSLNLLAHVHFNERRIG